MEAQIVSMVEYNGRIIVATPEAVYDITDASNPIVLTTRKALDSMVMGKKYTVTELDGDRE